MPVDEARSEDTPYGRYVCPTDGSSCTSETRSPAARETDEPDEAYADWPGDYEPVRLPRPF